MSVLPAVWRTAAWESSLALLDCLPVPKRRRQAEHLEVGRSGEEAAFFHLRRSGLTVIAFGWRSGRAPGDLDLVAWEGDTLCFVEVKTRTARDFAAPESAVDREKRRSLRRLAGYYLRQFPDGTLSRFDVLSVYLERSRKPGFEHFRDAFGWTER